MTTAQSKVLPASFSIDGIATITWYCNRPKISHLLCIQLVYISVYIQYIF